LDEFHQAAVILIEKTELRKVGAKRFIWKDGALRLMMKL
jgi:hypothetical protein